MLSLALALILKTIFYPQLGNIMKKILFLVLVILITLSIWLIPSKPRTLPTYCVFCNPAILKSQSFYEDDLVLGLCTHKPMVPGHSLIIPKRHVERFEELREEEIARMGLLIQKVNAASQKVWDSAAYLLLQKNGVEVGQTVPHVHFHYIPRKQGDDSTLSFLFKMFYAAFNKPISPQELSEDVERFKKAFEELPPLGSAQLSARSNND